MSGRGAAGAFAGADVGVQIRTGIPSTARLAESPHSGGMRLHATTLSGSLLAGVGVVETARPRVQTSGPVLPSAILAGSLRFRAGEQARSHVARLLLDLRQDRVSVPASLDADVRQTLAELDERFGLVLLRDLPAEVDKCEVDITLVVHRLAFIEWELKSNGDLD